MLIANRIPKMLHSVSTRVIFIISAMIIKPSCSANYTTLIPNNLHWKATKETPTTLMSTMTTSCNPLRGLC